MTEVTTVPVSTKEEFDGTIENAYGRKLSELKTKSGTAVNVLEFEGTFDKLTSYEVIPANEMPSNEDVLALVNNKRKANARQKAMQAVLDAAGVIKPELKTDVDLQIATIAKVYVARGMSEVDAEAAARLALGIE